MAMERYEKEGKDPAKETSRIYHAMYAGVEREGKNMPIQGANADIAKVAMGCGVEQDGFEYMWHVLEPRFGAYLVNFVYDEFVVECPEDRAKECEDYIGACIKRAGARFLKQVVMDYEGCIDDKWNK
jgi:DNA polymerase I-like protein with 3'-5' exonuclease and polymerase domains